MIEINLARSVERDTPFLFAETTERFPPEECKDAAGGKRSVVSGINSPGLLLRKTVALWHPTTWKSRNAVDVLGI